MLFLKIVGLSFWTWLSWEMGLSSARGLNTFGTILAMSFFIAAPWLYLLPTLDAWKRRQPNLTSIALVNIFLGWSLIGWVLSLAWAYKDVPAAANEPTDTREWLTSRDPVSALPPLRRDTPSPLSMAPVAPAAVATSVADELRKLAELKAQGILTDDEFAAQKLKLLHQ